MPSATFYPAVASDNGYANNVGEFFSGGYNNAYLETGRYGTNNDRTWIRVALTGVPAGASITSAILSLTGYDTRSTSGAVARIAAVAADDPAAPASAVACMALSGGGQYVDWTMPATAAGTVYQAPDIASVVQEFVSRPGYIPGAHLLLLLTGGAGTIDAYRRFKPFSTAAPALAVQWSAGAGVDVPIAPLALHAPDPTYFSNAIDIPAAHLALYAPAPSFGVVCDVPVVGLSLHAPTPTMAATATLDVQPSAMILRAPAPAAMWTVPDDQLPTCQVIYTLTLTGAADGLNDVVIPMTSFQSRLSADAIHYLSAVVPNSRRWADAIASRRQGQWVVKKGLLRSEYALRQALLRYEAAAEAEAAAVRASTLGGWLAAMAASVSLTTAGLLEQYTVPAYWPGGDRITPVMAYILAGSPTNSDFVQWFVSNGYAGSTIFDWREAVRLLQSPSWLSAATGGYYTSWRQLCGLDGGGAYIPSSIITLTDAKAARQAELSAIQADPSDWSAGGTVMAEIIRVGYQSLSWARGSEGDSATITGQSTVSVGAAKSVAISGIQYEALDTTGKRRLRCEVSLWLAPGDVATWSGESMVVGEVQHIVSAGESYMEITEA